jgi:hypothetical protein
MGFMEARAEDCCPHNNQAERDDSGVYEVLKTRNALWISVGILYTAVIESEWPVDGRYKVFCLLD